MLTRVTPTTLKIGPRRTGSFTPLPSLDAKDPERVGLIRAAGLTHRGDVIDVDAKLGHYSKRTKIAVGRRVVGY